MKIRDLIIDELEEGAIILEGEEFDGGIIGVSIDGRLVYDYDLMVESLSEANGMTQEEATEYIDYNTIRALPYMGELAPIIIRSINERTD